MRFPVAGALSSLSSAKQAVADIGVRGGKIKQQNKQHASSMVVLDENTNIMDKEWIKISPDSSRRGTDMSVNKVTSIIFCVKIKIQRRNSMIIF